MDFAHTKATSTGFRRILSLPDRINEISRVQNKNYIFSSRAPAPRKAQIEADEEPETELRRVVSVLYLKASPGVKRIISQGSQGSQAIGEEL
jgi:hypothetical protein